MNTIYSRSEENFMRRMQERKRRIFAPIVVHLNAWGISANAVSIFSAAVAIVGAAAAVALDNEWIFVVAIWIHFILDGLDGTLARSQGGGSSKSGVVWDLAADTVGIFALTYAMIAFQNLPPFLGSVFGGTYLALNVISLLLMLNNKRYEFVIRPRVYIFCALPVYLLITNPFTNFLLTLMVFTAAAIQFYFSVKGFFLLVKRA